MFYNVQISTNYEEIILKYIVLSIALARQGTILPVLGCNNSYKNV